MIFDLSNEVIIAFLLTLVAGLSTGVGGFIGILNGGSNKKFLALSLGFSAGVMIYVSMVELLPDAIEQLSTKHGGRLGMLYAVVAFFVGMAVIGIIDRFVPEGANPHEPICNEKMCTVPFMQSSKKAGLMTAFAIAIHNFPEGMASFVSALQEPELGIPIIFAIAMHNIPEGIAVAVPIYYATASKKRAFFYSLLSGIAEPLGAVVGYLLLAPIISEELNFILFAFVAGIMVYISLDELLPSSREYGNEHTSIYGLTAGMFVMALSLWMFA